MSGTTEAFSRVKIDALLRDAGWDLTDGVGVLLEHGLPDGTQSDYVLCDRSGRPISEHHRQYSARTWPGGQNTHAASRRAETRARTNDEIMPAWSRQTGD